VVQEVVAKNLKTGQAEIMKVDGVFVFIGHFPNTQLFEGQLAMDGQKFLITDKYRQTSVPGVFAAGEVQDPIFKQAVSSAGHGCEAAIAAERWLAERGVE
jgi:thioredoxin reductase (NADPH)